MKMRSKICGVLVAGVMGIAFSYRATAEVSDEEFKALKDAVQQLGDKVQKLEQTHEADQKTHEADQLKIQQLQQQVGETQKTATDAQQQAGSAARMKRKINQLEAQMEETQKVATEAQGKAPAATDSPRSRWSPGDAQLHPGRRRGGAIWEGRRPAQRLYVCRFCAGFPLEGGRQRAV